MHGRPCVTSRVNDIAWRACDTFRGTLDPAQYKDYILVMLFIKYMSDLWKDKREQYDKPLSRRRATRRARPGTRRWCGTARADF
jgi:type I restriction enzyme M protein